QSQASKALRPVRVVAADVRRRKETRARVTNPPRYLGGYLLPARPDAYPRVTRIMLPQVAFVWNLGFGASLEIGAWCLELSHNAPSITPTLGVAPSCPPRAGLCAPASV